MFYTRLYTVFVRQLTHSLRGLGAATSSRRDGKALNGRRRDLVHGEALLVIFDIEGMG